MRERLTDIARAGVRATGSFLGTVRDAINDWLTGGDLTVVVILSAVALVLLFVLVPNRRRY